ncbi:dnaJ homolog subfamily C member 28 [Clarias gariepinus]|uniref:dnaJ homolog subfamily C member 28 n=1 Tax=Clarias gariepinus TaxID=13013 RepID=UPI00234D9785|nr:dnaJ homolog subfamily C member 28 [Clarias gariepinus]XP_053352557.1 dnaJ homolog subfamily C member 28 [Clarias gariepinus]XP_053352558.1 dnaJ homolog subfamily C member 28 [Clarias gariepinus]
MSCSALLRLNPGDRHRLPFVYSAITFRLLTSSPGHGRGLKESLRLLQLPKDKVSSHAAVKEAYLRMAKLHHPDSGAPTADAALFSQIEEAYRFVLAHLAQQKSSFQSTQEEEEEEEEEKVKRHTPQHRHYLNYEGVGSGTPSQRERQYQQFRMDRATDEVLEYRYKCMEKAAAEEGAMVLRDTRLRSKKIKITQAVERLVEDLIQESMARGDFRNLSGAGKPLSKFDYNPYADPMTHNLNRILIDNGYQHEWIVAQKEIKETIGKMRKRLLEVRARLGNPMKHSEQIKWQEHCATFSDELAKLNKKVDDFNLIVPLISWQMVHFNINKEMEIVLKADQQHRKEKEKENEKKLMEEKENAAAFQQNSWQRLIMWMKNLLKCNDV